jgi:hypothetical protein
MNSIVYKKKELTSKKVDTVGIARIFHLIILNTASGFSANQIPYIIYRGRTECCNFGNSFIQRIRLCTLPEGNAHGATATGVMEGPAAAHSGRRRRQQRQRRRIPNAEKPVMEGAQGQPLTRRRGRTAVLPTSTEDE